METVHFKGIPCHTYGTVPAAGSKAPEFNLTAADLSTVSSDDFKGKTIVLNIFPSLDTDVCARSVRRFNEMAGNLDNTAVVCVSEDLPFAMSRFCTIEGLENVIPASAFRSPMFGEKYGVMLVDGPLAGLLTRAVIIIGSDGTVKYRDLVNEITDEPDYEAAINVLTGKF
ncbi:MAG: thiol peroxidase [Paramuribaculum sp.]|nr:thiol peroxidase [Paramuribaculum sp.]MDE6489383.1 thiol peroxidase [Paramuribaculum sp.]